MTESPPARLAGWWADRHLRLSRLEPAPRRAAVVGLALAAVAALAMIMPSWPGIALGESTCTAPRGQQVAAFTGAAASLAALAYGLSLVAAAATAPGARTWRLPRTRFLLTLLLPTVLLLNNAVLVAAPSRDWVNLALNHVRGVLLFVALVLIVSTAVATRGRGPTAAWGGGLLIAVAMAGVDPAGRPAGPQAGGRAGRARHRPVERRGTVGRLRAGRLRAGHPPLPIVLLPLALVASYGLLSLAWLGPRAGATAAGGPNVGRTLLLAGVPLLAVTVATVVLLVLRPRWRRHIAFGIGLLAWIALNIGLPTLTGGRLGSSPVAFDLLLTGVIAVLAVAGRLGWQRSVTPDELVLLLVTTSLIIELPLLIGALPDAFTTPLLIFAFLSPGLAAVLLEAGPLNDDPAHAPHRVHTTVGLLCVGYGLVAAMALAVQDPLGLMQELVGFFNGVVAVPFAVVLVAVLSANRHRATQVGTARSPTPADHPG